ncbi:uncharacterized protein LOC134441119 [Engraulis encrasicolus]|uniref:uncharacterized protein LOC134441119 n=1 Tax=Engraulis encrasicolus TaxID=184585 RepID=UPI002FD25891
MNPLPQCERVEAISGSAPLRGHDGSLNKGPKQDSEHLHHEELSTASPAPRRPVSPCPSLQSDKSMEHPPIFSGQAPHPGHDESLSPPGPTQRAVSPSPSLRSDKSMEHPPIFSDPAPQTHVGAAYATAFGEKAVSLDQRSNLNQEHFHSTASPQPQRPVSPSPSLQSDKSMENPPIFSGQTPHPGHDESLSPPGPTQRAVSPSASLQSDKSMENPPIFSGQAPHQHVGASSPQHPHVGTSSPQHPHVGTSSPQHPHVGASSPQHPHVGASSPQHPHVGASSAAAERGNEETFSPGPIQRTVSPSPSCRSEKSIEHPPNIGESQVNRGQRSNTNQEHSTPSRQPRRPESPSLSCRSEKSIENPPIFSDQAQHPHVGASSPQHPHVGASSAAAGRGHEETFSPGPTQRAVSPVPSCQSEKSIEHPPNIGDSHVNRDQR